jgi:hypothetical protein
MLKTRIQLYVDPKMKRRIELVAAKYNLPVTQYCFEAVEQRFREDDVLDQKQISISVNQERPNKKLIQDLRALHKEMEAYRQGQPLLDIEADLDQIHEKRERDILGLR